MRVSFILTSRNDNYCGNSPQRLFTSLAALSTLLQKNNLESYEIVLVDWNSEIPLLENPEFKKIDNLVYINVKPEIAKKYSRFHLSEVHALNLAARSAKGDLLLRLDQDTIIGERFINLLKEYYSNDEVFNKLWWSSRRETNETQYNDVVKNPIEFINQYGNELPYWCNKIYKYGEGAVGIFGVPRKLWMLEKGYNENMMGWGHMELEFRDRLVKHTDWFHVDDNTNTDFYHIWHIRDNKEHNNHNYSIYPPNKENWGCSDDFM